MPIIVNQKRSTFLTAVSGPLTRYARQAGNEPR